MNEAESQSQSIIRLNVHLLYKTISKQDSNIQFDLTEVYQSRIASCRMQWKK